MNQLEPPPDQLMREAAAWFARMRGPAAETEREGFEAWLRRGALHRAAFNRAAEIFAMGKVLADDRAVTDEERRPRRRSIPAHLGVAAALAGLASLGLLTMARGDRPEPAATSMATSSPAAPWLLASRPGERRVVRLPDGSRIGLSSDTILEVRLDRDARRFDLRQGRARFEVFHEHRPFIVLAAGGRVTARGTLFDVTLSPDRRVTINLIQGIVDVDLPARRGPTGSTPAVRRLRAGDSVSFPAQTPMTAAPARTTNSLNSHLTPTPSQVARDYDNVSLQELIAAANRGASRPIRLGDASIGQLRLSGRFRLDDTEILAERLALLFDLSVDRSRPSEVLLLSR